MADEIEEAAQRLLAFLPEETRALLDDAEHILGMTQLVAENAKRCGVEANGPDWDGGLGDDCWEERWSVCGVSFIIQWPYSNYYRSWTAQRDWADTEIKAPSFQQLFDKIVATVTSGELGPDELSAICSGTSDDWSAIPRAVPAPRIVPELLSEARAAWSSEPDGQPKSGHASSPEHRGCLYRTMLWAQQTENDG